MMASIVGACSPPVQQKSIFEEEEEEEEEQEMEQRIFPVNTESSPIFAVLETRDLWKQFDELGTEMIVTRRGRRMFPPIKVELHDLKPSSSYILLMDLVPVDKYRYKYQNSSWVKCFEESCAPTRLYVHPESPAPGSYWMDHVISFYKLKLTNNQLDKQGHIIVNSMHRYQPRLHVVESSDIQNLNWENFNTIIFPGTQFTTVTAYQNDKITQLKIENNPFAKGFRHPMSRHRMRSNYPLRSNSDSGSEEPPLYAKPVVTLTEHHRVVKRSSDCSDDEPSTKQLHILPNTAMADEDVIQVQENPALKKNGSVPMYIMYTSPLCSAPHSATATIIQNGVSSITTLPHEAAVPTTPPNGTKFQIMQIASPNGISIPPLKQDIIHSPVSKFIPSSSVVDPKKRASLTSSESSSSENDSDSDTSRSPQLPRSPPPLKLDGTPSPKPLIPALATSKPMVFHNGSIITRAPTFSPSATMDVTTMEASPQQSIIFQAAPSLMGSQKILVPVHAKPATQSILLQPNITTGSFVFPDQQQQQQQLQMMQTVPIYQMGGQFSAVQPMQLLTLTTAGGPHVTHTTATS